MKTFLIVLSKETGMSRTYALKEGQRVRLTGFEAREKVRRVAKSLGVESEDDLSYTPKILAKVRIYLAVIS